MTNGDSGAINGCIVYNNTLHKTLDTRDTGLPPRFSRIRSELGII